MYIYYNDMGSIDAINLRDGNEIIQSRVEQIFLDEQFICLLKAI